jgi:hypothetical protein
MAKDLDILCNANLIQVCKDRGQKLSRLNDALSAKNKQIAILESAVMKGVDLLSEHEQTIIDLTKICCDNVNLSTPNSCNCFYKWVSIGSNPNTGDLLKQCSLCNQIGIR